MGQFELSMGARDELALQARRRAPPWITRWCRAFEFCSSCLRCPFSGGRRDHLADALARCGKRRIRLIGCPLGKA